MQRLILIILSTFVFLASPALAKGSAAAMWVVSQRSGDARVVRGGFQPVVLTANAALAPGDIVTTGPTGRATLARGSDYIVVAPRSELRLPATPQPSGYTRVIQTLGTMLFKVRHTGTPHFAVDTPMLAAVVKGTTFTIVVDKDRSAVQVIEGAVEVTAADGGMQELVERGRTVFIDRADPKRLIVADANTLGNSGSTTGTSVKINGSAVEPLSSVVALTSGLVRAEAAPVARAQSPVIVGAVVATVAATNDSGSLIQPNPGATADAPTGAAAPIAGPIVETLPAVAPVVAPVVDAVVAPIANTVAPVVNTVVTPVVNAVVAPVVTPVVAPVVNTVVAPIVNTVVTPVVAPIVNTVVAPVVAPVVTPLAPVVAPVVAPLAPVLAPVTPIIESLLGG